MTTRAAHGRSAPGAPARRGAKDAAGTSVTPAQPGRNAAVFYHPEGYLTTAGKLMGRHAAGEGFLHGFARHGQVERLYAFAASREHYQSFCEQVRPWAKGRETAWLPQTQPERLVEAGGLFIPGPGLSPHAWQRRCVDAAGYSLTGVTHTICSERVMDSIGDLLIAPVEEWDALICTSPAVKEGAQAMLSGYAAYLAERLAAPAPQPRLQLPVIPLGVDCDQLGGGDGAGAVRDELRRRHKIGADDVVVLFFGRLSYHAKAHPLPMYAGLEAAARATRRKLWLIQAGWFANEAIKQAFVEGARALCPSVATVYVDGRQPDIRAGIWHAADIFCSFSDNVQETFGLTPVEAMAAGLPVVASDWNGYRGTVEQGVTGFLIPTTMPGPGSGEELAYRHFTGMDTYDRYIGYVSQSIAVDVAAAAQAFTDLIGNPDVRRQMGGRGRERARRLFDWSVVIPQYQELWAELDGRRRAAGAATGRGSPLRADPFAVFRHYATHLIDDDSRLAAAVPKPIQAFHSLRSLEMNNLARQLLAPEKEVALLLRRINEGDNMSVRDLLKDEAPERRALLRRTIGWLIKLGIVKRAP